MISASRKTTPLRWLAVGVAGLAAALATMLIGERVALFGYLTAFTFWLGAPLGCAGLIMIHRLTGGRWGWAVLAPARAASQTLPLLALAFIPVALGLGKIYPWASTTPGGGLDPADPHLWFRRAYLAPWFFIARAVVFLALWVVGGWCLFRPRPESAGPGWTPRSEASAAVGLMLLVLTVSFAGTDWVGSLTTGWYSSIFGFYLLTSFGLTAVAILILSITRSDHPGPVPIALLSDLGNLLLTFVILHAYMAFSQFLITWTGNLPGEIGFYQPRGRGVWAAVAGLTVVIQFFLPLAALIMRFVKRRRRALAAVAWAVLASQSLEAAWLVLPSLQIPGRSDGSTAALASIPTVASLVGIGGLWMAWFEWARGRAWAEANTP